MALPRRKVLQASRSLLHQQSRRHASHHHEPVKESFGTGFYLSIGAIPVTYVVYKLANNSDAENLPWLTRFINSYDHWLEQSKERNELHTKMVEQAGADKLLLSSSRTTTQSRPVDIKFQEHFNVGSPYNVPAGQGTINLEKVIEHYKKRNVEQEEDRIRWAQRTEDPNIPGRMA